MIYANENAIVMCTGCPGVPAKVDGKKARTVRIKNKSHLTDADKKLKGIGFGMCFAIPTTPKKCNAKLGNWTNVKSDVIVKGNKALLFPNTIPCLSGPGMLSMIHPGQRKQSTGQSNKKTTTFPCDWKGCNEQHEEPSKERFPLQNIGVVTKKKDGRNEDPCDFTGIWLKPFCFESIYSVNSKWNSEDNWFTRKSGKVDNVNRMSYTTQRHHVIPVVAVLNDLPKIKENLRLLGWDVNNGILNGIRLPMYWQDIFWHDIPNHNGGHSNYNESVFDLLKSLENTCGDFCKDDNYDDLWGKIEEVVRKLKGKIVNWKKAYLFNSNSISNREKSFAKAKIPLPNPNKTYNRKFDL